MSDKSTDQTTDITSRELCLNCGGVTETVVENRIDHVNFWCRQCGNIVDVIFLDEDDE